MTEAAQDGQKLEQHNESEIKNPGHFFKIKLQHIIQGKTTKSEEDNKSLADKSLLEGHEVVENQTKIQR